MDDDYSFRFGGIGRLYGQAGLQRLREARVAVVGLGGVGSWIVEALARSGVGHLTLIDLDEVCVSNVNRQLHALEGNIGRAKAAVLAERARLIQPTISVDVQQVYFSERNADALLSPGFDVVVDAIDALTPKAHLLAECCFRGIRVVTSGGAGGKRDATQIRVADITKAINDPLLAMTRKKLRKDFGFPRETRRRWRIPSVFSPEEPVYPHQDGSVCATPEPGTELRLNCDYGYGTATHITGTVGFIMSGLVLQMLTEDIRRPINPRAIAEAKAQEA
ncbi:MAG: tRNA threonylcarbamoyladenosine dehydratase [Verrucomicrobiota bacterium JB022]|nr:tRNA threonylcarbamoyladenosine dehydratase [Verrucomicrobiota bacterium JB022]